MLRHLEDYFARLGVILSRGSEVRDLLVIHPVESAWTLMNRDFAAAAAFVAQHSIFPQVGTNRPDEEDIRRIAAFVRQFRRKIDSAADSASLQEVVPPGGRPYKTPGKVPLRPTGGRKCTGCGVCVERCPVQAIPAGRPRQTDPQKCIACGRCIVVCPARARRFGGLLYKIVRRKFVKAYSVRKEPDIYG